MYKRTMEKVLRQVSNSFTVLLVTDPKRGGKTTLSEMCAYENMKYVSLDDLDVRSLAKNNSGLFIQT